MSKQEGSSGGIISWFVHNHVAANILMMFFIIGGIVSVSGMRTETFPALDPKLITVTVVYPGATPYEVADGITSRVEEVLIGIEGIKRISSTASEGIGSVNVEIKDFVDGDAVLSDVESAVNSLIDFPPENAERPIINKIRVTPNVLSLALHGDASENTIKYWAESVEDELRLLPGVALTSLRGIRDYEISIEISEDTLRHYQLSLEDIGIAVQRFSRDIPAGTIESEQGDFLLRVQEKRYTGEQFRKIPVRQLASGRVLTIGDLGQVIDGFEDARLQSRFNGEPAAFIDVKRSESSDTLAVATTVKDYLKNIRLPEGLHLTLQVDETTVLKDRINLMLRNAILGFALVFLILLLFLDLKLAFWVSAAIPISFLGGLMIINFLGYSINMISLFALIVVLGIVVDDGIVTGESIFEAQQKQPGDRRAVIRGVKSIIAPVTVGVATTMAAFGPLTLSTGTLGQIIKIIPIVVISILSVSLIEAYFILPAHLSKSGTWSRGFLAKVRDRFAKFLQNFIRHRLLPAARLSMRWRYLTLAIFVSIAIVTGGLVKAGIVRFVFFPVVEGDEVIIAVTMPQGTPFETTQKTLAKIEDAVFEVQREIDEGQERSAYLNVSVNIGERPGNNLPVHGRSASKASNVGQVTVRLVPSDFRAYSSVEIEKFIRKRIEHLPNIEKLEFQSSPIGAEADIEIELAHPEDQQLILAAEALKQKVAAIEGTKEVADSFDEGKTELIFSLNEEGLALGLAPAELGQQLRTAYYGLEVQRFQRGRSELVVYVRYPKSERESRDSLKAMRIRLPDGREVPLSSVATIREGQGYSQIQTVNGRRIVSVTADIDSDISTPIEVMDRLQNEVLQELKQEYPDISYSFEGESRDQRDDLASLSRNMMIALLLIFMLLGAQLRSYIQPFIIMAAIPFGVVGAVLGHLILGYDLTFISLFGIVALMGVVINDSVVLIDYLNAHWRDDKPLYEAAQIAVARRFRPILLTTLSTVLGLLPMLLETSLQAKFLIPMVVSLTSGLVFATVVILFLIPCLILVSDDVHRLFLRFKKEKPDTAS